MFPPGDRNFPFLRNLYFKLKSGTNSGVLSNFGELTLKLNNMSMCCPWWIQLSPNTIWSGTKAAVVHCILQSSCRLVGGNSKPQFCSFAYCGTSIIITIVITIIMITMIIVFIMITINITIIMIIVTLITNNDNVHISLSASQSTAHQLHNN